MKILVVDDDLLAAEMTGAILEASGYQPLIAENAIEGLELLGTNPDIAMVVSDLNMPLVSGIDFFRELREQGRQIPFILLTGDAPDSLLQSEPDLNACLTKDFDLAETLPSIVSQLLHA
ncbi:response regulator [Thiopseudomonas denitrificans]|uniref:Response regulator receiver domain-containing protein n=1 Tax=Thiopseudomonas denitrificans TaxID=1501432 RepID=A0A4R6TWH7_9GAMM|nr:response regulator [Thiopseudomonas denitrificans]TDQ38198.1 response regulator receiver domain-containing protein [Thiopseudomonas denitrificans]